MPRTRAAATTTAQMNISTAALEHTLSPSAAPWAVPSHWSGWSGCAGLSVWPGWVWSQPQDWVLAAYHSFAHRRPSAYCGKDWEPRRPGWLSRARRGDQDLRAQTGGRGSVRGVHTTANYWLKRKKLRKEAERKRLDFMYETRAERRSRERRERLRDLLLLDGRDLQR